MSEPVVRLLFAIGVIVAALAVAALAGKFRKPVHPVVHVGEVGDRPGVVLFTSTDCSTCKRTIERLKQLDVSFREVTYELERNRFDTWGVVAVPLTVIVDSDGKVGELFTGVPSRRRLLRAATTAGIPHGS